MAQRHLVSVWNPSYEADAMDQHLSVLLANATRFRKEECSEEEVYVWWGKIRSANRQLRHCPLRNPSASLQVLPARAV